MRKRETMNYGFEEKPHPVLRVIAYGFSMLCGALAGFVAELLTTAFGETLSSALPSLGGGARVGLYLILWGIPAGAFIALAFSRRARSSARLLGATAAAVLVLLVAGELTGVFVVEHSHGPFYLVPAGTPDKH